MNKTIYTKIAAGVAVVFSLLTIVEGLEVLTGASQPDYIVLMPLLIYNVFMGFVGLIVGALLWLKHKWALTLTTIVVSTHLLVLLIVGVVYLSGDAVAIDSLKAMGTRTIIWLAITGVVWKGERSERLNPKKT